MMYEYILDSFSRYPNLNYVVRKDDKLIGVISLEHLKEVLQIGELAESLLATDIMDAPLTSCKPETTLPEAYELFEKYDSQAIPIVDEKEKPLGILEKTAIDHYIHTRILELHRKIEKLG